MGLTVLLTVCLIAIANTYAQEARANPRSTKPNAASSSNNTSATTKLQKQPQDSNCGTLNDVSKRVEICAKPLMDLLQGTVEKWPRSEEDAMKLCESYAGSERCIRETARKCTKGLPKSILSALAQSVQRARKRECGRTKAAGIVRTTMCIEKHQDVVHNWMNNVTARLSAIELQEKSPDRRINAACCIVRDIEIELKATLDPFCPAESGLINRLYRIVMEDVIELICSNPKCKDYLKGYTVTKSRGFDGFISIILRIVFSLDAS